MKRRISGPFLLAGLVALAFAWSPVRALAAASDDDAYLAGYVNAVVQREFGLADALVEVEGGIVTVTTEQQLGDAERDKLVSTLRALVGVTEVVLHGGVAEPAAPETLATDTRDRGLVVLPERELFSPLLADPRWPHFAAGYQYYLDDDELGNVGAVSFGETFALLEGHAPLDGRWQLGLQGGVFSIFDLDTSSLDLVNSDFLGALLLSYRRGDLALLARALHQSSHLGDEFLLRNRVERVNLSYEAVDALLSYDLTPAVRVYGGGGGLVHREPSDLDPLFVQSGAEVTSPWTLLDGLVRPLVAADVQLREENDWDPDISVRGGIQIGRDFLARRRFQLLAEYYDGRSPNGQFFVRDVEYVGVGLHLHF